MAQITLDNLAHSYLSHPRGEADYALKTMTHVWEDGGAYALLGPSGCGKTTLLNIISGLLRPSEGRVLFGDEDVTDQDTARRNIAQVFQFPVVYDTMTVRDNLAFPLRNRRADAAHVAARVQETARMIGLEDMLDRKASGLTADAKQKISLGRGMVREDVNAILFDEPLTVIDPHMKWELRTQLRQLHRELAHTMIYVTHDQTEALTFADRVAVMFEGRVVQMGTPEELFDAPNHVFVGYFIGSPGMNFLTATIEGQDAVLPDGARVAIGPGYPAGPCKLGIRPEHVVLGDSGEVALQVQRVEDLGRHHMVRGTVAGEEMNVQFADAGALPADPRLHFPPGRTNVYVDDWRVAPQAARETALQGEG